MAEIQQTFVDLTSTVPAVWFNRLQKFLAGFLNLKVTVSGTAVQVVAASSDGVASVYIGGEMRRNDSTVNVTIAGGADTYNVYAVATAAVDTFALEFSATTPATSPYRKIAEVDWSGSAITALRGVRGRIEDHEHDGVWQPRIDHGSLIGLTSGDPHTQYSLPAGSRDFTGAVGGVTPTATAHLATKAYADSLLSKVPVGGMFWWPSTDAAPTGFILADGSEVSRTTYSKLFARIGTDYGNGDGSTTFNLPNTRGRIVGGTTSETYRTTTGGVGFTHTHTQAKHTHAGDAHTHTVVSHFHAGGTTTWAGAHTHTQGVTGSDPNHTHNQVAHVHGKGTYDAPAFGSAVVGTRHTSSGSEGLFPEQDVDSGASSTSHTHSSGSYYISTPLVLSVQNSSSSASFSHTHPPSGNAYQHTHSSGSISGEPASGGFGATATQSATHTHTNQDSNSSGGHNHTSGDTGTKVPVVLSSGGSGETSSDGDEVSSSQTFPYVIMHGIIRYD